MATMWQRTMAFLGLVEEPYDDDYDAAGEEEAATSRRDRTAGESRQERSNVRTIGPSRSGETRLEPAGARPAPGGKVHVTNPGTFNDVEEVGANFRNGVPVIMNLAGADESVAKRLLDFASGLIFGLDGRIERVGDRVFLLTPVGVDVSTEERRRLSERGFFNQA
ncbi:MAG: cell division protein SepF [Actinomycetota bacterium]|jgi:cell division inhibitor SepF|nr:cell division protein SepF [Euzebyaceae bacterium]MDQ3453803.1 cell division protein SepF [Actinomycetota bacterium]